VLDQGTLAGPLNATAPTPISHAELMRTIAATVHRRLLPFSVPNALLRAVLLHGVHVRLVEQVLVRVRVVTRHPLDKFVLAHHGAYFR